MADTNGLGFENAALVFGAALLVLAAAYYFTNVSRVLLFWAAFILTRPLGATLGDLLDKPIAHGGFAFSRYTATAILAAAIVALILLIPQRPGFHPGAPAARRRMTREAAHGGTGVPASLGGSTAARRAPTYRMGDFEMAGGVIDPNGSKTDSALAPFPSQSVGTAPPLE